MDFRVPQLGEGVYEAELVAWRVQVGDTVQRGQPLMEVLTDKATMEVPAAFAGTVSALLAEPGQQIKVGDHVLSFTTADESNPAPARPRAVEVAPVSVRSNGPSRPADRGELPVKAAPSVRQLARKLGIDLAALRGSGPEGRILLDDLSSAVRQREQPAAPRAEPPPPAPSYGKPGTRVKLVGVRRKIADHMLLSKRTAPHYSYVDECDVTDLVRLREGVRESYTRAGVRLTYLPFVIKAVVQALKEVPIVNASLDEEAREIVLHDRYHIGIAVAAPQGLLVPVVHDADRKDLAHLAREIDRLTNDARAGRSRPEDLKGGTFTITSIGSIGGLISTPIINHPEVGILGIGKIVKRPVYDDAGQIRPADMVYLSFSFDHRVVDGAVGAVFGNAVLRRLRHPLPLLLPDQL